MDQLTDQELIDALRQRLDSHRRALKDLRARTAELQETNRKLQESEALKSHFLSNIRNEINNPLASIIGLSRQLAADEPGIGQANSIARLILVEAFYLDYQLQNIFAAAELEAGEAVPSCARVEVAGIISSVIDSQRHLAERKCISIRRLGPKCLPFATDAMKLHLIVTNLFANALEFTPDKGWVEIEFGLKKAELEMVVRDSGPGIDVADHAVIFDRFRQLDSGSAKSHRGQGLGLSVVKALADLLEGSVSIADDNGPGAIFTLTLPSMAGEEDVLAPDGNLFLFDSAETF